MMGRIFFAIFLFFIVDTTVSAQPCSTLGQNPSTAFPVCGTTTFSQATVPSCGGRPIPVPCPNGGYTDINPFWYRFTCYTAGSLGFRITPLNLADDYDWQIFDITNRNPNDVYNDPTMLVSCNWSGNTGITGASSTGTNLNNCGGSAFPTFSRMPNLLIDHEYLMLVSNFSPSQQGYQLQFMGGTAVITNPTVPTLGAAAPTCDNRAITVQLSKELKCSSIAANGSDFTISPSGTIVSAVGTGCSTGFDFDVVTLNLSNQLAAGTYTIITAQGTDGNTLLDNCDNAIATGITATFTITALTTMAMGTAVAPACPPSAITMNFPEQLLCNSISPNGTDFVVTGPAAVSVVAASSTCTSLGLTSDATIQFASPVTTPGVYTIQLVAGSDGNGLVGECGRIIPLNSTATFTVQPVSPLPIGTIIQPGCAPTELVLTFPDPIQCNSIAADGSDFALPPLVIPTITGATANCTSTGETNRITIQLSQPLNVSGAYLLTVRTGTDGNTLIGPCSRSVTPGDVTAFNIPVIPPATMTSVTPLGCAPTTIRLNMSAPINCSSIAANGSDFAITGPSPVTVIGATGTCTNGVSSSIDIQLSASIVVGGTYRIQLHAGVDGNTLVSDCFRETPAGAFDFAASDTVSARFNYNIVSNCVTSTITFTHPTGNSVSSWNWSVGGNAGSTAASFTQTFPGTSQQTVQLIVSNGVCSDTRSATIVLDNKVIPDFSIENVMCPEDFLPIVNLSTGPIDSWSWSFGNNQTSTLKDPPAQRFPLTGRETIYTVTLRARNSVNNCEESKSKTIRVLATCLIAVPSGFTPNNDGLNDFLYPLNALKAVDLEFRVFNRWGQLMFLGLDWQQKWDGKLKGIALASDMYVWTLKYTERDTRKAVFMKGTSMLIR